MTTQEFDYGVGDDIDNAVQHLRADIAARIRRAAAVTTDAGDRARIAYESAARIAEATR